MQPFEFFLYLTFLVYSYYYKFALFVIYVLLIIGYSVQCVRSFSQIEGIDHKKKKLMASTFSSPNYSCYNLLYEFDVTQSMRYAQKLSKENEFPVTITHVALRAIILGLSKSKDILGVIKWGNVGLYQEQFQPDEKVRIVTLADVKGKDLVIINLRDSMNDKVADIARKMKPMVHKARTETDQIHKKRSEPARNLPTFFLNFMTAMNTYLINRLAISPDKNLFEPKEFGNSMVSNVGVFGVKRAFPPLIEYSGSPVIIAMGKVEKKPVVRDNKIVIRSMLYLNFAFDVRYAPPWSLQPCFEQLKAFFENPEAFETSS